MKRIFSGIILFLFIFSIGSIVQFKSVHVHAEGEEDVFILREARPYLFGSVGDVLDLTKIAYKTSEADLLLSDLTLSNVDASLTLVGNQMTITAVGVYTFELTVSEEQKTIYVFSKEVESTEYILYEMSFSGLPDGDIPLDYTLVKGIAGIESEVLYLQSPATSQPTQVLLPAFLNGFKNYIIETDFTISSFVEPTRWASVMYRFSVDNYFQMAIRQNATATNGVEFAKAINGQWNVPLTTSYTEAIDASKWYRLKIDLFGSDVKEYINDELLITYDSASDYTNGAIGMQASGTKALYDNIKIIMPEAYIDNSTVEYSSIPEIYQKESGLVLAPSVIQTVNNMDDIINLQNEVRPTTAMFRINNNIEIVQENGIAIAPFIDALEYCKDKVIPAFYIKNVTVATTVAGMLKQYGVKDVFFISPNQNVLVEARNTYNMIRGVLEVAYDSQKPELTSDDLLQIKNNANIAEAVALLLPAEYASKDNVSHIQQRLMSVWINTHNEPKAVQLEAIISGANGVVTESFQAVYDLFDLFPENTVLRRPFIIGHRGLAAMAPENTLEGAILAYEKGADMIELDIQLTTDKQIVLMHDTTTTRTTNGSLVVEESTLAQLKELTITDAFDGAFPNVKIPTLAEYFTEFKGKDVVFFIEIKSQNDEIVDYLKQLIDEHNISDQVVVICFIGSQIIRVRSAMPEISVGYLSTALINKNNLSSSILASLNAVVPAKTTVNPEYSQLTDEYVQEMNHRAISVWPWTINENQDVYSYLAKGIGGITTDKTYLIENEFNRYELTQHAYTWDLALSNQIQIKGKISTPSGIEYNMKPTVTIVDDGNTGIQIDASNNVTGITQEGEVLLFTSFTTTLTDGSSFTIVDDILQISVIDTTVDPDPVDPDPVDPDPVDPEPVDPVDTPIAWIISGIAGGVTLLTGFIFLGIRFLKKPKI